MAVRDTYTGGQKTTAAGGANNAGFPSFVVYENVIDFSKLATAAAQNDVVEALAIPAGTLIQGVQWEVVGAEGASRNFAIGDGSDTDGYVTTTTANTLATGCSALAGVVAGGAGDPANDPLIVTGYSGGKYYSAADTIDILAVTSGGLTTAKIRVKAFGVAFG
jgi:hypothetical protein